MADNIDKTVESTTLWNMFQDGQAYQSSCQLTKNLPTFVRFYEGNQWATATENTKNLPRPVVNIIKMICRNKKSAILSTPIKLVYRAEDENVDADKFTRFAEYILKELGQENLDKKAIDDAVKKGSYFYHYFWDAEAKGKDGIKEGGLRCDIIDPLNIFFANPTETDEQKQKWILVATREDVDSVKAKCDKGVDKNLINGDESESKYNTIEQEGSKLCTVLTRYFRKNGEVYCEKATKSVVINKAFPIAPDLEGASKLLGFKKEDAPNNNLPDNGDEKRLNKSTQKAYLYPIVAGQYEQRENSIYGLGEIEGIIPNQKSINFNLAMSLLNAENIAWGKWIVHPKALRGQSINNEPGQVLVDYSETGVGIRKSTEQTIQSMPLQLVDTLTQLTRTVTGSSEVMTGETIGSGMSGAAIAQLQAQASQPVEELKATFWLVKEKQGKVLAQFFKLFYESKDFTTTQMQQEMGGNGQQTDKEMQVADTFNSADFADTEFSVVVEATAGTKASAAGDINALDTLLNKGAISIKTYLNAYPKDALSNRTEILKGIEEDAQGETQQLKAQITTYEEQLKQSLQIVQQQKEVVDKVVAVIQENNQLKVMIANLRAEAVAKIQMGNEQINYANAKIQETTKDASEFAQSIANSMAQQNYPING